MKAIILTAIVLIALYVAKIITVDTTRAKEVWEKIKVKVTGLWSKLLKKKSDE